MITPTVALARPGPTGTGRNSIPPVLSTPRKRRAGQGIALVSINSALLRTLTTRHQGIAQARCGSDYDV